MINIGLVGGGELCKQLIQKTSSTFTRGETTARVVMVADSNPDLPGMKYAREMGIPTVSDYRELYRPEHEIHLIIPLTPDEAVFQDILKNKPLDIRLLSFDIFDLFWRGILLEDPRLRERSREIQTILDGIQDFIVVMDPHLNIIEANQAFLKHMGFKREQVVGKKCHEVFYQATYYTASCDKDCPLTKTLRKKQAHREVRTWKDKEGGIHFMDVSLFPLWENGGKISKFIQVSHDITALKKKEEETTRRLEKMVEERTRELKETHARLLHRDKMASLGKLAASVVHEINNPISGILSLLVLIQRILREGPVSEKELQQFQDYVTLMETETRRISRIVSNLLAFSRQGKMEVGKVDLNKLVEKTLFLHANRFKLAAVNPVKRLASNLPLLEGSEDHLEQVIMNLVSNAVEAMEPKGGGTLTVETSYLRKKKCVRVRIQDTGVGMSKDEISHVFEPFYTTKKKGKGVGLGLSLTYGIIQEHGGTIRASSEPGKGTRMEIELPVSRSSEGQHREELPDARGQNPHRGR